MAPLTKASGIKHHENDNDESSDSDNNQVGHWKDKSSRTGGTSNPSFNRVASWNRAFPCINTGDIRPNGS